ncbi:MAG: Holliday junction resolvase [uncultured bacterium]|uniref:Crossover junction endodeoxyribonuclease RuvC n=1 Tax=Candidatus Woesebacteria bacterium RIFCSPLOWO2_01_FULL_39_21 TaxID=1802519 RepID=A0A1F8BBZ1_9BACT|nr:MAG: Holliday junction resolvase [uncultured bacterium]OGM22576.1 MAG: crossover junction endodeoxyribonuclease RuvC [Candidatus Woesebacteria bacterium RIFCSPHIGHO2_01_FULL_39_23]OGM61574.1 MAG: crossover junction endodeoxyribonuclease RuvC [Candidatus Woesebacteria bacterium RIFCSPLOWO2_01_FULL_39_21]
MLVIGIDPGTATTGWGAIEVNGNGIILRGFGLIETNKELLAENRLFGIYREMRALLKEHRPDVLAIEKLFFATNAKTAIQVGQAQGVMLLSAAAFKVPVFEYAPGTIKKVIAGDGRADKKVIQQSVRKVLGSKVRSRARKKTHFDNSADALAVALCHVYSTRVSG